jgi:hypothetical protein
MISTDQGLAMRKYLFNTLVSELARRGNGDRESGAFLLARSGGAPDVPSPHRVTAVVYYDDVDPGCLTGGITFSADGYTALAALCRRDCLRVVADIHTHPGSMVNQSTIDAAHPMTALPGHIALIVPRYARDVTGPADLGVHILQPGGKWTSFYSRDAARILRLTSGIHPRDWLLAAARRLRCLNRTRRFS